MGKGLEGPKSHDCCPLHTTSHCFLPRTTSHCCHDNRLRRCHSRTEVRVKLSVFLPAASLTSTGCVSFHLQPCVGLQLQQGLPMGVAAARHDSPSKGVVDGDGHAGCAVD